MGTYEKSRYTVSSIHQECTSCSCSISPGNKYLEYYREGDEYCPTGFHVICLSCSMRLDKEGSPVYYCLAVDTEMGNQRL